VITARDGEEALRIFGISDFGFRNEDQRESPIKTNPQSAIENPQSKIDLVILDLIMPGMDGKSCLKTILEYNPGARILMSSGFCEQSLHDELMEMGAKGYISKPYQIGELSRKIKEVMETR